MAVIRFVAIEEQSRCIGIAFVWPAWQCNCFAVAHALAPIIQNLCFPCILQALLYH